jgi:hypothetical protein
MASTPTQVEIDEFLGYELLKDINALVNLYGFRQKKRSDVELEFYRAGLNLEKLRRAFKTSPLGFLSTDAVRIVGPEFALLLEFRTVPAAVVAESLGLEELLPVLDDVGMGWIELGTKVRRSAPHMSAILSIRSESTALPPLSHCSRARPDLRGACALCGVGDANGRRDYCCRALHGEPRAAGAPTS